MFLLILTSLLIFFGIVAVQASAKIVGASNGRMIDLFTQKEPYSGKGINESSDAFAPQSNVTFYANVTYKGDPVPLKDVAFEVHGPANPYRNISFTTSARSNGSGIAKTSFQLQWPDEHPEEILFGTWSAVATVDIGGTVVMDTLTFKVGYIVEIISVSTIDENLRPKSSFAKATCVGVKLHIRNIAMLSKNATIVVNALDANYYTFDSIEWNDFTVEPGETHIFAHCFLNISEQAAIGNAMINASALTAPPSLKGVAYCPSVYASFVIVSRDVAVTDVTTSSIDVVAGQVVTVTVTVTNNGGETETFSVNAYYGDFLIQSPIVVASLLPNQNRTITFVWNTTYVPAGTYTIKAVADTVPGETETSNNTKIDDMVTVRVPRIFMLPRELSIVALVVAAALALFAMIILLTRRKKKSPQPVTLTVDVLPS